MYSLGHTLHALGATPDAYRTFLAALDTAMDAKALPGVLDGVLGLATLLHEQAQIERSAELCLHVVRHPMGGQGTKNRAELLWSDLKSTLPQDQVAALEDRVRTTPFETVVAALVRDKEEMT